MMKNKINIAELLRNCPQGMELDCMMYEDVYFDYVDELNIIHCYIKNEGFRTSITFNQHGTPNSNIKSKCVIFPQNKTTWEGFVPSIEFKDGDVVISTSNNIHLISCCDKNYGGWESCCGIIYGKFDSTKTAHVIPVRFATEEEKAKLFQAIKDNGYRWNPETKTLKKLTESKEDTDDKTVMSGIYFNREDYADEVELHLNNYEIEIHDGKTYAIFKNQETKISKPKFKDGDVIVDKYGAVAIYKRVHSSYEEPYVDFHCGISSKSRSFFIKDSDSLQHCGEINSIRLATEEEKEELFKAIKDNGYKWNSEAKTLEKLIEPKFKVGNVIVDIYKKHLHCDSGSGKISQITDDKYIFTDGSYLYIQNQDNWELVPNKFDITTLKPFNRVLVRIDNKHTWSIQFFERLNNILKDAFVCMGGVRYCQCIPFEGNEHLLNTANDCDNYFKTWENEKDDNSIQCD